jgi:excisionase family DNA binding protein
LAVGASGHSTSFGAGIAFGLGALDNFFRGERSLRVVRETQRRLDFDEGETFARGMEQAASQEADVRQRASLGSRQLSCGVDLRRSIEQAEELVFLPARPRVEDAARILSVGRSTVYDLIRSGRLRSIKIGRRRLVPRSALDAFIDGNDEVS